MAGYDSLQSLLRLQSPRNVGMLPPGALASAGPNADLMPSEGELKVAQGTISDDQRSGAPPGADVKGQGDWMTTGRTGGVQSTPSRQELEDAAMSTLGRKLGLQQRQHAMDMEKVTVPAVLKAEGAALADRSRADSAEQRLQQTQQSAMDRLMMTLQARDAGREDTQANQKELQAARLAAQQPNGVKPITSQILTGVNKAQQGVDQQWFPGLRHKLFGPTTADKALVGQLEAALQYEGSLPAIQRQLATGASADQIIQNATAKGVPVTSLQERYIRMKAGR